MSSKGIKPGQTLASGQPVADSVAEDPEQAPDTPLEEAVVDTERMVRFDAIGFTRMTTEWSGEHRSMMQRIQSTIDGVMVREFEGAFLLMNEIYELVRDPQVDGNGEPITDQYGFTLFERSPTGAFIEDWARLGHVQREHFIYKLTTQLFEWSQKAAGIWTEAMFAKGIWQEEFARAFDAPAKGTVEDRTAKGNMGSAEARYFAIFSSALSRRADALVRSMELLNQRLKDTSTN